MVDRPNPPPRSVEVEAPARIHLGVLDLRRDEGRYFGGLGVAVRRPRVRLRLRRADGLVVEGPSSGRVERLAERHLRELTDGAGARIRVLDTIPSHVGLGSGTQLALSVGRGLDLLHGRERSAGELAVRLGRGRRSAVGSWTFAHGGFVLEGGVAPEEDAVAPLLARFALPESWRVVLVRPDAPQGLSGEREEAAFGRLPPPEPRAVDRVAHVVLMQLLPAVATGDLEAFGRAASAVERATGDAFRAAQDGSRFAHDEVEAAVRLLAELGAVGGGQSSWGPTVYGFAGDPETARDVVDAIRRRRPDWRALAVPPDNHGARARAISPA